MMTLLLVLGIGVVLLVLSSFRLAWYTLAAAREEFMYRPHHIFLIPTISFACITAILMTGCTLQFFGISSSMASPGYATSFGILVGYYGTTTFAHAVIRYFYPGTRFRTWYSQEIISLGSKRNLRTTAIRL